MSQPIQPPVRPQPGFDRRARPATQTATPPAKPPRKKTRIALSVLALAIGLVGCSGTQTRTATDLGTIQQTTHTGSDDLLTAGLGEAGLRSPAPPAFVDSEHPTAAELRRRAIWTNWRGIADLAPGGGYGTVYGSLTPVTGREFHAFATLPGRRQPHRVLVQLPDNFDLGKRCVIVTASSGSRGIYGAIALAGAWGLSHGCAVAYTDKGAGTGYVDTATDGGTALDGRPGVEGAPVEFKVPVHAGAGVAPVAVKHAHSGDNPEADWGLHVKQAADFALQVLATAHPQAGGWTSANTRVIAVGVSNGGGAVLRAAELPGDWLDGVVAVSPNVLAGHGGRALFDYATEAAIWMPCALNAAAFDGVALARPAAAKSPAGTLRCASLRASGELKSDAAQAQAEEARSVLLANGWTDGALSAGALSTGFDLWRAIAVTYASAYARTGPDDMPCGYRLAATGTDGAARAPTAAERAAWWSDASGIPPGAGVGIVDASATGNDPALAGLRCLRGLWTDAGGKTRAGIAETRAALPRAGLPVIVVHGADDGLVPEAFSGGAYARWIKGSDRPANYWRAANAQHFDAFLGLPVMGMRYLPMLPYGYRALDAMWATVAEGEPLSGDKEISNHRRAYQNGTLSPLKNDDLGELR